MPTRFACHGAFPRRAHPAFRGRIVADDARADPREPFGCVPDGVGVAFSDASLNPRQEGRVFKRRRAPPREKVQARSRWMRGGLPTPRQPAPSPPPTPHSRTPSRLTSPLASAASLWLSLSWASPEEGSSRPAMGCAHPESLPVTPPASAAPYHRVPARSHSWRQAHPPPPRSGGWGLGPFAFDLPDKWELRPQGSCVDREFSFLLLSSTSLVLALSSSSRVSLWLLTFGDLVFSNGFLLCSHLTLSLSLSLPPSFLRSSL